MTMDRHIAQEKEHEEIRTKKEERKKEKKNIFIYILIFFFLFLFISSLFFSSSHDWVKRSPEILGSSHEPTVSPFSQMNSLWNNSWFNIYIPA